LVAARDTPLQSTTARNTPRQWMSEVRTGGLLDVRVRLFILV